MSQKQKSLSSKRVIAIPRTIVLGAKGFVGKHFHDFYQQYYPDIPGTHYEEEKGYLPFDLANFSIKRVIEYEVEYAIISCGIANPVRCEKEPERTHFINVEQTVKLAKELSAYKIVPILFSSDYVFDGTNHSYKKEDCVSPLNLYGKQKAELEKRIQNELGSYCIFRTSKIYGTTKGDGSFLDEMANKLSKNLKIKAAADQFICPIHITDVIQQITTVQQEKKTGLFQLSGHEVKSRYACAMTIAGMLSKQHLVEKIFLGSLADGVNRPRRVVLEPCFSSSSLFENILQLVKHYIV